MNNPTYYNPVMPTCPMASIPPSSPLQSSVISHTYPFLANPPIGTTYSEHQISSYNSALFDPRYVTYLNTVSKQQPPTTKIMYGSAPTIGSDPDLAMEKLENNKSEHGEYE